LVAQRAKGNGYELAAWALEGTWGQHKKGVGSSPKKKLNARFALTVGNDFGITGGERIQGGMVPLGD